MSNRVPGLCLHKASGQAVVYLPDATGKRRPVYLGPHGSTEATKRYRDAIAQHLAGQAVSTAGTKANREPTVARVVADFLVWTAGYYRDADGNLSGEVTNLRHACVPLLHVLRDRRADSLTCADLHAVRDHFAQQRHGLKRDEHGQPIPGTGKLRFRRYVNAVMRRVRAVLRWGAENGLVPGNVWHSLSALRPLTYGRGGLPETTAKEAVPRELVDAALPHLPPTLQAAVELMWWSGLRVGELCNLRMCDLDRSAPVWIYKPASHKGTWKGRDRVIRFGPRCIELLRPLLCADANAHLFQAVQVVKERKEAKRASRKTKVQPSQLARDGRPKQRHADRLTASVVRIAIYRACDAANVQRWSPHLLRHAAGTRLVREVGDEAARVQLGHADERMVRRYSLGADDALGREVAARHA